jgi:hypothetical protein
LPPPAEEPDDEDAEDDLEQLAAMFALELKAADLARAAATARL